MNAIVRLSDLLTIPRKVWFLVLFSYFIPILTQFIVSDDPLVEMEASILWFLCLISSVLITYYMGLQGGMLTTVFTIVVHILTEIMDDSDGVISYDHFVIMGEVAFTNILLSVSIGYLIQKLKAERTRLKQVNRDLTIKKEQLHNIFDHLDVAIWSLDMETQLLQVSAGLERLYGIPREEILDKSIFLWKSLVHPDDKWIAEDLDEQFLLGIQGTGVYRIRRHDGKERWVQNRGVPLVDQYGNVLRIDGVILDITEEKNKHEIIKNMAYQDPLTHLPNRRSVEERLTATIKHGQNGTQESFSVLFLDLDGFKSVNDTFGHDIGDLLLQEVASRLKHCIRKMDIVGRLAGDEFIILLPQTHQEKAIEVSQRIIDELQNPFHIHHHQLRVTTSIGISLFPEHGQDVKTLMKHADDAMYLAKKYGKNKYHLFRGLHHDSCISQ
ncbi:sensor domain-containing diguanylate cyclase [Ammoniphilus resinae]|uniref:Diguanylate cyclase (GGDEF)-like protein/PAS domain S-box-containing protein n=1 Tax=Ammoniphilus resinae TaxID=861532 RepID=A0ABS4GVZ8_9BACL|nr:sensor domain-containing diguanylate cyclase [Ammoniphilus resinae]MBP1934439.1 diguanylate cyclase (GGDEF)-like protein/PAS domain S-box-containing protein [Ammoniphilus resinae]